MTSTQMEQKHSHSPLSILNSTGASGYVMTKYHFVQ